MKREQISDAIGRLDERMIEPVARLRAGLGSAGENEDGGCAGGAQKECGASDGAEADNRSLGNRRKGKRWLRGLAAAACLCFLCMEAVLIYRTNFVKVGGGMPQDGSGMTGDAPLPGGATVAPDGHVDEPEGKQPAVTDDVRKPTGETADVPGDTRDAAQEPFVAPETLFADAAGGVSENGLMLRIVPVGQYEALYEGIASAGSDVLEKSLGAPVSGAEGFYRLGGHDDLQYVISDNARAGIAAGDGERYGLWEFQSFQAKSYPYSDVLTLVYGITRADAIAKLVVSPPTFDNTDEGMRIQEEIGTYEVTDRDGIEAFFEIVSGMMCYGSDRWELIDYGSPELSADGEGAHNPVRLARYLTLVTDRGCEIDRLKYTAVSDMFYEYSGVAYEPLVKEQAARVREILKIK